MERMTKLLVIVSMAAAILLGAVLGARLWPELLPLMIGSFVAAAGLSLVFEEGRQKSVLLLIAAEPDQRL